MSITWTDKRGFYLKSFLLILLSAVLACSSDKNSNKLKDFSSVPRVEVDNLQPIIKPENKQISVVTDMAKLPNGGLAILDSDQSKVLLFRPDGTRYSAFGRKGKGPGEFVTPRSIEVQDSVIEVLDVAMQRINRYDLKGNFIKNYKIEREASFFGFVTLGKSLEYYTVANGLNGKLIGYHSAAHDSTHYFGEAIVTDPPPVNNEKAFKTSASNDEVPKAISNDLIMDYVDGNLYVFLKSHSRLQKYRDGDLLWDIKIDHPANANIFEEFVKDVQSGPSAFGVLRYIEKMDATANNVYLLWNGSPQTVVKVSKKGKIKRIYELPKQEKLRFNTLAADTNKKRFYLGQGGTATVYTFSLDQRF